MPSRISPIYELGQVKYAKHITPQEKSDSDDGLHPSLKELKPGDSLTFKPDMQECVKHGGITELYSVFASRVMRANYTLRRETFFIVAQRGQSDTQNNYTVKYNARKLKRVTKPGGVKSFTIWRI